MCPGKHQGSPNYTLRVTALGTELLDYTVRICLTLWIYLLIYLLKILLIHLRDKRQKEREKARAGGRGRGRSKLPDEAGA